MLCLSFFRTAVRNNERYKVSRLNRCPVNSAEYISVLVKRFSRTSPSCRSELFCPLDDAPSPATSKSRSALFPRLWRLSGRRCVGVPSYSICVSVAGVVPSGPPGSSEL